MLCPFCSADVITYQQVLRNGNKVITKRCSNCSKCPDPKQPFFSIIGQDWQDLPMWNDGNPKYIHVCAVNGCTSTETEVHHFAPRQFFEDAKDWPVAHLCKYHHKLWHDTINK